jgi:predicted GH43/DUF377 family glycosyl hydrolase
VTNLPPLDVFRADVELSRDPARVMTRFFVPGQELESDRQSTTTGVIGRILALPEDTVESALAQVFQRYDKRHSDLKEVLEAHYALVARRVPKRSQQSAKRKLLIGACFTQETSIEGAALFNPSVVPHPDQSDLPLGAVRLVLSLRAVSEGHISTIEFRTGVVGPDRQLTIDEPERHLTGGVHRKTAHDRDVLRDQLDDSAADDESSNSVLGQLPPQFDDEMLESALAILAAEHLTRAAAGRTADLIRRFVSSDYEVTFNPGTTYSQRVLAPYSPAESQGMEDARFVRFIEADGSVRYCATYTAFDGHQVGPQLIETADFLTFRITRPAGAAAKNKGMALFPRKVNGRFLALSRWDRESNAITASDNGRSWDDPTPLTSPDRSWGLVQLGNAGSPIETPRGWLVITHGVGPLREYSLGALLLDLDDPSKVIGSLREPLLQPEPDEREGYVPNVVYSCGEMIVGDDLFLPYGVSDSSTRFAFVNLERLLDRLIADGVS